MPIAQSKVDTAEVADIQTRSTMTLALLLDRIVTVPETPETEISKFLSLSLASLPQR